MANRGIIFKEDAFGNSYIFKRLLILCFGFLSYFRFTKKNTTTISGTEHLQNLPGNGVLFVSNHQTYFAEVAMMFHVFAAVNNKRQNSIKNPWLLFRPKLNVYFIAALETMKKGILPKIFAYAGSVSIKRTWREAGQDINRQVDLRDISNIGTALDDGWVITFPQGTTTPYVKGRRGTVHIIKKYQPIVIPIVVDGFRRAFDKKGLFLKKKGCQLSMTFKAPLDIDYSQNNDALLEQIMDAIEQSEKFQKQAK